MTFPHERSDTVSDQKELLEYTSLTLTGVLANSHHLLPECFAAMSNQVAIMTRIREWLRRFPIM